MLPAAVGIYRSGFSINGIEYYLIPVTPEVDIEAVSPPPEEKKYYCQRCLNHGKEYPRKGHKPHCEYANCQCDDCAMVEKRRQLNNTLSKKRPTTQKSNDKGPKIRDPRCARCKVHGIVKPLRGHKKTMCAYKDCFCEMCNLVMDRRTVMAQQIKLRRNQKRARRSVADSDGNSSGSSKENSRSPDPPTLTAIAHPMPLRPIAVAVNNQMPIQNYMMDARTMSPPINANATAALLYYQLLDNLCQQFLNPPLFYARR